MTLDIYLLIGHSKLRKLLYHILKHILLLLLLFHNIWVFFFTLIKTIEQMMSLHRDYNIFLYWSNQ